MVAYYNENDPFAASWLRNLIRHGLIAAGDVDERDIQDVRPDDLRGYTQCHFFAGIGVWSYAARNAGIADDEPLWSGSCPCQPFSPAGKGKGFDDERHLWPSWHWLISECRPSRIVGEQVADRKGLAWLDLVQSDMEGTGYAFAADDLCAASVGAPHIRQRQWFVAKRMAYTTSNRTTDKHVGDGSSGQYVGAFNGTNCGNGNGDRSARSAELTSRNAKSIGVSSGLAYNDGNGLQGRTVETVQRTGRGQEGATARRDGVPHAIGLAYNDGNGRFKQSQFNRQSITECQTSQFGNHDVGRRDSSKSGQTDGFWSNADWLYCRDGKWRPVEPGTFPLVNGTPARVGRLRGYGNAIVAPLAEAFIKAALID